MSDSGHGKRGNPERWPVDPKTGEPIPPKAQPGYYPGYSTLGQQEFWEEATRRLVLSRVHDVPPLRFFAPEEARFMQAICDRILPQDDRDEAHRIPVLHFIDERLHSGRRDGYRYEKMPSDPDAYRLGMQGIETIARHLFDRAFLELEPIEQDEILKTLHDGKPPAGEAIWRRMEAHRFWMLLIKDVVEAYYAHPWAWDEIGFGGPAYPRGYMRLEHGDPEPWEVEERRYEWEAPKTSLSGKHEPIAGTTVHRPIPGQGGTH